MPDPADTIREALGEIAVDDIDPRLHYVMAQMDRDTLPRALAALTELEADRDQARGEVVEWKIELERAEADRDRLQAALAPFANPYLHGEPVDGIKPDNKIDCCVTITFADVERARAALATPDTQEEPCSPDSGHAAATDATTHPPTTATSHGSGVSTSGGSVSAATPDTPPDAARAALEWHEKTARLNEERDRLLDNANLLREERDRLEADRDRLQAERDELEQALWRMGNETYPAVVADRDRWKELREICEADRDRYREALEQIANHSIPLPGGSVVPLSANIARAALDRQEQT